MSEIEKLDLNPKIIASLKAAKLFDVKTILIASHAELSRATKLSYHDVALVVKAASQKACKSKIVPSLQLSERHSRRISLGCKALDDLLGGGVPTRGITEISGESASGKTQFCLQLSLQAQLDEGGSSSGVVYICTECVFPIKRLYQLIKELPEAEKKQCSEASLSENVTICQIGDVSELKQCVHKYLPSLVQARQIGVVVVDSVAAIFRAAYEKNESRSRAEDIQSVGYSLHCLSRDRNLAIVCVNQVTDTMSESHLCCGPMDNVSPALGLSWANMITTRLMLSRTSERIDAVFENGREIWLPVPAVICKARVIFAPDLPQNCAYYAVTSGGLKSIGLKTINNNGTWPDGGAAL